MYLVLYLLALLALLANAPPGLLDPQARAFIFIIGAVGIWRYGWNIVHLVRALVYKAFVFPAWRRRIGGLEAVPPLFVCLTSHRVRGETTTLVYRRLLEAANSLDGPVTVVAAVAEMADQRLIKRVFAKWAAPERVRLVLVRLKPQGKRDALATALVAVARQNPPKGAVVAVMDGDTVLPADALKRCLPFFAAMPDLGGLTTDEEAVVEGGRAKTSWHRLRFAQRHLLMCSMGLGRTLLTMTGRFALFRAEVATDPGFIDIVRNDALEHWRLGRVPMLTGEDKSTWFWLLERGLPMLYVPDVQIVTVEHPPHRNFFNASSVLMMRWFGNMLRASARAIALGPGRIGLFAWWCLIDQRLSMWTPLIGPLAALFATLTIHPVFLQVYLTWVLLTRLIQAVLLVLFRPGFDGLWPPLIYYNQVWGAFIKTYVLFRPNIQRWTRQQIRLEPIHGRMAGRLHGAVSASIHALALLALATAVAIATEVLILPTGFYGN